MSEEAVTFPSAGLKLSGVVHVPSGMRSGERRAAFLVLLAPGSGFVSLSTQFVTDRYTYLAAMALVPPVAAGLGWIAQANQNHLRHEPFVLLWRPRLRAGPYGLGL